MTPLLQRIISFFLLIFFGAAHLPVFPAGLRPAAYAFSIAEEREVGEKLLSIVRQEFKLVDDPDIVQYINGLGREILAAAGPQYFDYHFFVINNKDLNAFAAPSGLIFLHTGLLELLDSENELVGVMAHECGHVTSRHIAGRIEKSSKVNIGTMALVLAGMAMGGGALSEALIAGSMAAGASMNLKFSRQDEEEADRLAFSVMQALERDPAAMVKTLQKIRKFNQFRQGQIPPYLLTHPEPAARMGYVQDLLLINSQKQHQVSDEFDFKRIKYRVLSIAKDPALLKLQYLKTIAAAEGADTAEVVMARLGLALAYRAGAEFDRAREELLKVIAFYPHQPVLKVDLGVVHFEAGRFAEALVLFREARAADAELTYATYYLARTLQQLGKSAEALALYEELLLIMPDFSQLYYDAGKIKAAQGDKGAGYYYLGLYNWYEGEEKSAKFHLQQAVAILPTGDKTRAKAKEMLDKIERLASK